jgi:hypothetical protein
MNVAVASNDVMEKVFDEAVGEHSLNRISVQRELLSLCENDDEKRDLLVYLARTKQVHVADIICDIKTVDNSLAMKMRREETLRWEKSKSSLSTSLRPVFSGT